MNKSQVGQSPIKQVDSGFRKKPQKKDFLDLFVHYFIAVVSSVSFCAKCSMHHEIMVHKTLRNV